MIIELQLLRCPGGAGRLWLRPGLLGDERDCVCTACYRRVVWALPGLYDSYLVDPASSHMLVSKIKPCMSKYKQLYTVKLRMAH